MPRPLTIEVFKDTETPCVDPSIALPAIHYINSLTDNSLQFIGGTKEVQVSRRPHMPTISPLDTSDFYGSSADIQLILTERDVLVDNREGAVGYSMKNLHHSGGIALVSTYRTSVETAPLTVAHEIGHLYGLSYGPEKNDAHCYDQSCLMYHEARHVEYQQRRDIYRSIENQAFCSPCGQQLAVRAFYILQHRDGLYVPKELR